MTILIRDGIVLTVDRDFTIHDPGAVFVADGKIVDVGPSDAVLGRHPEAETVIDAKGKVVLPGFVSAHNHLGYTVFRGRSEDIGFSCVTGQYYPMGLVMSREERRAIGSLTLAELLRGGVTTVAEMEEEADIFAPVVEKMGGRALIGVMIHDTDVERMIKGEYVFDDTLRASQLAQAVDFAEEWHGGADGRVSAWMTANMTISSSPDLLQGLREAADRLGLRLSIHLGWGQAEVDMVQATHGMHPFDYVERNGFLASDVVCAHCYHVGEEQVDRLAHAGAHVAHCPLMNSFRGTIAPALDYIEKGVGLGLGIDNYFSDNYDVVRAAIQAARIRASHPEVMQASDALTLATMGSARALGIDDKVGSLESGKRADIQIVDMARFGLTPVNDALRTLVYHGHGKDVDTVMVDGRVLVEGGEMRTVDAAALIEGAAGAAEAAWSRFAARYGGYVAH
ncbi:MAG: amidohydrolase family protein [Rhodospirillaceae bacterium]|jgi:5-methylthioadenosine/S-adenosylhomocysteine deaminase|nr:amidohydrolase family protein [Rhodospirillaceae bacterium]